MKRSLIFLSCVLVIACGQNLSVGGGGSSNPAVSYACPTGPNVMAVTVDGTQCSSNPYVNEPCAAITICAPGSTTNCQVITNILVDTGSYGLRVFSSVLNSTLKSAMTSITTTPVSADTAGECVVFGSGKTWGPVRNGDVYLAGEPKAAVAIQLIDSTYSGGAAANSCSGADTSPAQAQYNGILGVGLFNQDCGASCVGANPIAMYYACNGTTCTGQGTHNAASVALNQQVANPVPNFSGGSLDTNGLVFLTAAANSGGNLANNGCVVFGINTETNNIPPTGTVLYPADAQGQYTITLGGKAYTSSFLDSGSNGLYLDSQISIPACSGWLCPSNTVTESFTAPSAGSVATGSTFQVANADTLFNTSNLIFNDLGGQFPDPLGTLNIVDLGIPFFYGRAVYIGVQGTTSNVNIPGWFNGVNHTNGGPYFAY